VDLATDLGVNPLMHTTNHQGPIGHLATGVALLLEAGADPDMQNGEHNKPGANLIALLDIIP
jgi:hypothetical protein